MSDTNILLLVIVALLFYCGTQLHSLFRMLNSYLTVLEQNSFYPKHILEYVCRIEGNTKGRNSNDR
jgi:hypothetical protein